MGLKVVLDRFDLDIVEAEQRELANLCTSSSTTLTGRKFITEIYRELLVSFVNKRQDE